jgi:hypothetical protein
MKLEHIRALLASGKLHGSQDKRLELWTAYAHGAPTPPVLVLLDAETGDLPPLPEALANAEWRTPIPGMGRMAEVRPTLEDLGAILACPAVLGVYVAGALQTVTPVVPPEATAAQDADTPPPVPDQTPDDESSEEDAGKGGNDA